MNLRRALSAFAAALVVIPAAAQTAPPVDAGSLLEQQRRQPPATPPAPDPGVLPVLPAPPAEAATDGATTTVRRFEVAGASLLDAAAVQAVLAPWVDRPAGLAALRQAAGALEDAYRARGWLARVSLPAQDVTDGTVHLVVTEARRGRLRLEAGEPALPAALTERVRAMLELALPADAPLSLPALERALLLADELPGVRLQGSLVAGAQEGSTDLLVTLRRDDAFRGQVGLDNGGSRATGAARANAQLQWLSPLGLGEQFGLGASASAGSQYLSLSASAPLPGAPGLRGWRMNANASALRYQVRDRYNTSTGLAPRGDSDTLGLGLQLPLVRTAVASWQLTTGLVQTRLHNEDDNLVAGRRDTTSRARTRALQLGISGYQYDRWAGGGATSAGAMFTQGRLSLDGSPASHIQADAATAATAGSFSKLRWNASRLQQLLPGTALLGAVSGQFASANLDASEKFYLGGPYGVRAYPNGEAGGSTGTLLTLELRQDIASAWQASAFYDRGDVGLYQRNRQAASGNPLVARNRVTLEGAGLALAWRGVRGLQVKGTWAHRLGSNPLATASGADSDGSLLQNRFWLEASLSF